MKKVIVFDFDGVLVDTNRLKYDAFFPLFLESDGIVVKRVLARIREKSRFEILRQILTELGRTPSEEAIGRYAEEYGKKVLKHTLQQGLKPGVRETLLALSGKYHLYLNSATPESSLREIVRLLDMSTYFRDVFGGPGSKEENLRQILSLEEVKETEVVVVGDGDSDYQSAQAVGCRFIGIANEFNNWREDASRQISTMERLASILQWGNL
jgi:phosphoglycolate phosphatase-like HAD superfamily hydrolase